MAIQLDLTNSQYGVPFPGAYFRIVIAAVNRTRNSESHHSVMIDVAGYATKPNDENTKDVDIRRYYCQLSEVEAKTGDTFLAKCYAWVMSQDDMAGSIGV
jgi:dihydropteroate synthase